MSRFWGLFGHTIDQHTDCTTIVGMGRRLRGFQRS